MDTGHPRGRSAGLSDESEPLSCPRNRGAQSGRPGFAGLATRAGGDSAWAGAGLDLGGSRWSRPNRFGFGIEAFRALAAPFAIGLWAGAVAACRVGNTVTAYSTPKLTFVTLTLSKAPPSLSRGDFRLNAAGSRDPLSSPASPVPAIHRDGQPDWRRGSRSFRRHAPSPLRGADHKVVQQSTRDANRLGRSKQAHNDQKID